MVVEKQPFWLCGDCGASGHVPPPPNKCPKCGSAKIHKPIIKKDGGRLGPLKKY